MNKKGFVVSAVLYPLLTLSAAVLVVFFSTSNLNKTINNMKLDIQDSIFDSVSCDCEVINNTLKKHSEKIGDIETTIETLKTDLENIKSIGNAKAKEILSGKTALVSGKKITGTMRDASVKQSGEAGLNSTYSSIPVLYGANAQLNTATDGTAIFSISPATGYYSGGGSAYTSITQSTLASVIGLTADKIVSGNTILGISGTYTFDTSATATASQILSGQTAWVNGSKITGTMVSQQSGTSAIKATYSDGIVNIAIPIGAYLEVIGSKGDSYTEKYDCSEYKIRYVMIASKSVATQQWIQQTCIRTVNTTTDYTNVSISASALGISADKIVKGATIAGVEGTATTEATDNFDKDIIEDTTALFRTTYADNSKTPTTKEKWTSWMNLGRAGGQNNYYESDANRNDTLKAWWSETLWDLDIDVEKFKRAGKVEIYLYSYSGKADEIEKVTEGEVFYTRTSSSNWEIIPIITVRKNSNSYETTSVESNVDYIEDKSKVYCSDGKTVVAGTEYRSVFETEFDSENKKIYLKYSSKYITKDEIYRGCKKYTVGSNSQSQFLNNAKNAEWFESDENQPFTNANKTYIFYHKTKYQDKDIYGNGRMILQSRYNHWYIVVQYYE